MASLGHNSSVFGSPNRSVSSAPNGQVGFGSPLGSPIRDSSPDDAVSKKASRAQDNDDDEEKIVKQLQKLAKKAEKSGYAIGIGHVKPKTLFVLEEQIPILKRQGFKFEFVSRMLH